MLAPEPSSRSTPAYKRSVQRRALLAGVVSGAESPSIRTPNNRFDCHDGCSLYSCGLQPALLFWNMLFCHTCMITFLDLSCQNADFDMGRNQTRPG